MPCVKVDKLNQAEFDLFIASNDLESTKICEDHIVRKKPFGNGITSLFIRGADAKSEISGEALMAIVKDGRIMCINDSIFTSFTDFRNRFPNTPCTHEMFYDFSMELLKSVSDLVFTDKFTQWLGLAYSRTIYDNCVGIATKYPGLWLVPDTIYNLPKDNCFSAMSLTMGEILQSIIDPDYFHKTLFPTLRKQVETREITQHGLKQFLYDMVRLKISMDVYNEVLGDHMKESLAIRDEIIASFPNKSRKATVYYMGMDGTEKSLQIQNPLNTIWPDCGRFASTRTFFLGLRVYCQAGDPIADPILIPLRYAFLIPWSRITRIDHLNKTIWTKK